MTFEEITNGLYPKKYNDKIIEWLKNRYGNDEGEKIFEEKKNFHSYYEDLPDYGGKKNGHAMAIYGGVLVFALYRSLPDYPEIEEIQDFIQNLFMEPFVKLGKFFDLNKKMHMRLIDMVFHRVGERDRKDILSYPDGFVNISEPYDRSNQISRYAFTKCPNADFAKKHDLLMKYVIELLLFCAVFTLMVKYAVRAGAVDGLFFYPKEVQKRAIEIGLSDQETINRKKKEFMPMFFLIMTILLIVIVGIINNADNYKTAYLQSLLFLEVMNWYDGIVIDKIWVGNDPFWLLPGTEDLPHVQTWKQVIKKRIILSFIWIFGAALSAAVIMLLRLFINKFNVI